MEKNKSMLIRYVYIVFVGILLAAFVGVGIEAFYKGPKYPETPVELRFPETKQLETTSSAYMQKQLEFDRKSEEFQKQNGEYSRNVSIIALVAAVIMLVLSLTLFKQIAIIADGLLLGGVLTLAYSVIRGFGSNDDMVRFLVVSASLLVALILGYIKFVKPLEKFSKKR
jgi:hypothetical protein